MRAFLRTAFLLSRPAGLPTIWSNCLAGWWLGGGGTPEKVPFLFAGATFLYLGAAFLNDAFDADWDRHHQPRRPIPAGAASLTTVWRWGVAWLVLGTLTLLWCGEATGGLALALAGCAIAYNAVHRLLVFSPALFGLCRFLLYLVASSTAVKGITGGTLWCGLALAAYAIGVRFLARSHATPTTPPSAWPLLPMTVPILLALIINVNGFREPALLLSLILALWALRCLRPVFWSGDPDVGKAAGGLVAGIVLVDWLAVAHAPRQLGFAFITLFLLALLECWAETATPRS